jgi:hypothetical protein
MIALDDAEMSAVMDAARPVAAESPRRIFARVGR